MNDPSPVTSTPRLDLPELEIGRQLFSKDCAFVMGAVTMEQMPTVDITEISFAGRSNVGKSSLINALTGRKTLARTSSRPGRTQQINFFQLDNRLMLTDLPGYGYARAPKKTVSQWTNLVHYYLRGRVSLRRVCLLTDSRHGLKSSDKEVMKLMDEAAVSYQVVLTKCDKTKPNALDMVVKKIREELLKHGAAHPEILTTSAAKGTGIPELRAALATLAQGYQLG